MFIARRDVKWWTMTALSWAGIMFCAGLMVGTSGCDIPREVASKFITRAGVTPPPPYGWRLRRWPDFRYCDVIPLPGPSPKPIPRP